MVIKSNVPDAIENNTTVILTCSAKGSSLSFKWTNGSAPIVVDGTRVTETKVSSTLNVSAFGSVFHFYLSHPHRLSSVLGFVSQTNSSSVLTIKNVLRTDLVGPIYCTASNSLTTKSTATPFNLTVYCKYCSLHDTIQSTTPEAFSLGVTRQTCSKHNRNAAFLQMWKHG